MKVLFSIPGEVENVLWNLAQVSVSSIRYIKFIPCPHIVWPPSEGSHFPCLDSQRRAALQTEPDCQARPRTRAPNHFRTWHLFCWSTPPDEDAAPEGDHGWAPGSYFCSQGPWPGFGHLKIDFKFLFKNKIKKTAV